MATVAQYLLKQAGRLKIDWLEDVFNCINNTNILTYFVLRPHL